MVIFFPIVFMAVFCKWPSIPVKLAMLWDFLDNKRNSTFLCFTFTEFTVANSLAKDANCNLGMKRQWQSANTQNPNTKNALPNPKTPTPKPQTQKSVAFYTSAYNCPWHNGYHKLHISCNSHSSTQQGLRIFYRINSMDDCFWCDPTLDWAWGSSPFILNHSAILRKTMTHHQNWWYLH